MPKNVRNSVIKVLATGFGLGLIPVAPGTFGSLLGVPFAYALHFRGTIPYMFVTLLFTVTAVLIAEAAGHLFGESDSPKIVIDEVAGFLVTMVMLPMTWQSLVIGFVVFRILDATKPGPIGYLDRKIKGGLGVVVDDVAAGIIGNIILQIMYSKTTWLGAQLS